MGKDKGKARKSLSNDKAIDRVADSFYSYPKLDSSPTADALKTRALKRNISKEKRQAYINAADAMAKQFASTQAKQVITDTQGSVKMQVKGFGN